MDFIPPQISTELVIHTHVPLYFHLLSPCVKCYCLKRMKSDNALHQRLEKKYILFFKEHKKCRWSVTKVEYFFFFCY